MIMAQTGPKLLFHTCTLRFIAFCTFDGVGLKPASVSATRILFVHEYQENRKC